MSKVQFSDVLAMRVAAIGDSITASLGSNGYYGNLQYQLSNQPLFYAQLQSTANWDLVLNAGVGGQRSDQCLTRITTEIIPTAVDVCVINSCYWNDVGQGYTTSFTQANIISMCDLLMAANIMPVLCTPTPGGITGTTAPYKLYMSTMAAWVRWYGKTKGYPVVDYLGSGLIDTATGTLNSTYNLDNTVHPNPAGFKVMGAALAAVLDEIAGRRAPSHAVYATDATDLMGGVGLFLGGASLGTGWTAGATPAGGTNSIVTDANVLGRMQRMDAVATAGNYYIDTAAITGWSAGDILEWSGIFTYSGGTSIPRMRFVIGGSPSPNNYLVMEPATAVTRGRFKMAMAIPTGSTSLVVRIQMQNGTGTLDIGQMALRNLTTLGVST